MKAINLIWIVPLCTIFGWFLAINFVETDFDITMDDNTRIAIQSLNGSIGKMSNFEHYDELLECKDKLMEISIELQVISGYEKVCQAEKSILIQNAYDVECS